MTLIGMRRIIYTGPSPQIAHSDTGVVFHRGQATEVNHSLARRLVTGGGFIPDASDVRWSEAELGELYSRCNMRAAADWLQAGIRPPQDA